MLRHLVIAALAALLLLPAITSASVPTGTPSPWEDDDARAPRTSVTLSVECFIVKVLEERTLLVRDTHGREHEIQIPEDAKIKPRRKRDFDGLKKLQFEHLQEGFELKLTVLRSTGKILRVKVVDIDPV